MHIRGIKYGGKDMEIYLEEVKAYDEAMGEDYRFAKAIIQHMIGRYNF